MKLKQIGNINILTFIFWLKSMTLTLQGKVLAMDNPLSPLLQSVIFFPIP